MDLAVAAALFAHFQSPTGNRVQRRTAGLDVTLPGGIDPQPRATPLGVVRIAQVSARLGESHGPRFVAYHDIAAQRARQLVV